MYFLYGTHCAGNVYRDYANTTAHHIVKTTLKIIGMETVCMLCCI